MPLRKLNYASRLSAAGYALLFGLCSATAAEVGGKSDIALPSLGADASPNMSPDEEQLFGELIMRQVRDELDLQYDPEVEDYIEDLGYKLVANSDTPSYPFRFFVVNQSSINAFAFPGGHIGVHSGLILTADNESELAAVLAHEVAHVTQRHLDRALTKAGEMQLPMAATIIAAIILGSQNPDLAAAAIIAQQAAKLQSELNFTRVHEREADHIGMKILTHSQFDPNAMPAFFERLQQNDRLFDVQVPEFLRTHPVTTDRIAESRDRARHYSYQPRPDTLSFHLVKAKLQVLTTSNPSELVKRYQAKLDAGSYTQREAELYGYALALLRNRDFDGARKTINRLIKEDRERLPYLIVRAQIELASGNIEEGLTVYRDNLKLYPRNLALMNHYASALLQHGNPDLALELFEDLVKRRPNPPLYQSLAKAAGESKRTVRAHQALAEHYFLLSYTHSAIEQLNLALKQKSITEKEKLVVESRLKKLQEIALAEKQLTNQ